MLLLSGVSLQHSYQGNCTGKGHLRCACCWLPVSAGLHACCELCAHLSLLRRARAAAMISGSRESISMAWMLRMYSEHTRQRRMSTQYIT